MHRIHRSITHAYVFEHLVHDINIETYIGERTSLLRCQRFVFSAFLVACFNRRRKRSTTFFGAMRPMLRISIALANSRGVILCSCAFLSSIHVTETRSRMSGDKSCNASLNKAFAFDSKMLAISALWSKDFALSLDRFKGPCQCCPSVDPSSLRRVARPSSCAWTSTSFSSWVLRQLHSSC